MSRVFTRQNFLRLGGTGLVSAALLGPVGCQGNGGGESGGSGFPDGPLTFVAAGEPGGGLDIQARMVEEVLQTEDLLSTQLTIENLGGGGGNPARATILERPNNGQNLVVESNRVFLSPLTGTTDMDVGDFTAVAKLTTEFLVWAVRADSEWESATDILEAVTEDPGSISFGVGSVPSDDQFNILRPAQIFGVQDVSRLNIVAFASGGDLVTNLIGNNVDVVSSGVSEVVEQVEAGDIRLLTISSPEPQPGATEDVPTWQELDVDFELDHWRGIFGPADMPEEALQWWSDNLEEASNTGTWEELAEQYNYTLDFEGPEVFSETLEEQRSQAADLIDEVGLGQG